MTAKPIRTGDPAIDSASRLYRPLTDQLGPDKVKKLRDVVADAVRASAGRSIDEIADAASAALMQAMSDMICAFNPATKRWQWWDPVAQQWYGDCP